MCIKNYTHCSVESVVERRQQPLHCRQSVNRSTGCWRLKHRTSLPRASEDRGAPFRDGPKTCCSETSTAQHIIYNTNRAFWSPLVLRKLLSNTHPGAPLPLPRPPKKKINNPPKNVYPWNLPSPVRAPGIDPIGKLPSVNPVHRTHAKDSHPKPASDRALTPSRTCLSIPLVTVREQQPWCAPTRMWPTLSEMRWEPPRTISKQAGAPFPHQAQCGRVSVQWSRTIRSLVPVRGPTSKPIPPPFHRLGETCSQTSLPKKKPLFFFFILLLSSRFIINNNKSLEETAADLVSVSQIGTVVSREFREYPHPSGVEEGLSPPGGLNNVLQSSTNPMEKLRNTRLIVSVCVFYWQSSEQSSDLVQYHRLYNLKKVTHLNRHLFLHFCRLLYLGSRRHVRS